ncbi:MAG: HAD-IA family hydrolase [Gammaproteobacteria bacterium]|uniref:HAD-IA family hydrolase n=1 Tax=Pseudomaricurvus alcaniphilus TaxID=1166482 RepID=UPI001408CF40|nr:HAD-IA family hydrolase [Gammaproteobacteria bacterium]NHN35842.1 HAD-IA family hydrolase [Pseudomaricurvus alcaniphilus]
MSDKLLFIFDWDGTLCDSTSTIIEAMHRAAAAQGLPVLADVEVMEIIGLALPQALQRLYPQLDAVGIEQMRSQYSQQFLELNHTPPQLFPGVETTLASLADAGHKLAIATGKSRAGLDRVLKSVQVGDWFHGTRCADETASKPDPLMLHQLLTELRTPVQRAVMIGDTEFDMEMARRANMRRIAVDYGAHSVDRLQAYAPLMSVSRVEQILALVNLDVEGAACAQP